MNGRLRGLMIAASVVVAVAVVAGAGPAGFAAQRPAPRPGVAAPGLTGQAYRTPDVSGIECFYVYPSCSSSDPSVTILIGNTGDTSPCTFEFTVSWGDQKSDTQTFPGRNGDGTIATFNHTYDANPGSFPVTVTGQVLANTDPDNTTCQANGGNYTFNLTPQIGLAALRFAPAGDSALTTPGLPVLKDDGSTTKVDDLWGPADCDGIADPTSYDYLGCQTPVPALSGPSTKDWPVVYPAGSPLTVNQAVFVSTGPVTDPVLTANASIPDAADYPSLGNTPMTVKKVGNTYQLTATKLTFEGDDLPAVAGRDVIFVSWTITDGKTQVPIAAGDEYFNLYVTAGTYAPLPAGSAAAAVDKPYESLLDVGTVAAAGKSGEQAVFTAIWKKFTSRKIAHPVLNPVNGAITYGPTFDYYSDDYPRIADWFNRPIGTCPSFKVFLATDSGHCGNFAEFLAGVLAFQGISADAIGLTDQNGFYPGFYPGPDPAKGHGPAPYTYMLVGPGLWTFGKKNAPTNYPYRDNVTVRPSGNVTISGSGISYKSTSPIAQGPITDPPMLFYTGDHAIVKVSLSGSQPVFVDPSYGNPQNASPYPSIPAYEKTAIAGFAVIFRKVGSVLAPLPSGVNLARACQHKKGVHIACYFQAVPYK